MGSAHASLGSLLAGKYLVDRELGSGGMGTVVSAVHQQLEQRVAIKLLHDEALAHPEIVERFKREARSVARLKNEHVVRVLDVGSLESGAPFMVMEHLDGQDLGDLLAAEGPLSLPDAVGYVLQACEAVAEAHAARIVHRDLKPANLFLANTPGGGRIIKVLDFGIAKALDDPKKNLTRTTAMMGTAYYMSPEQLTASREVDGRTDIWALGVVLYELLSGRVPFDSDNLVEIVGLILSNQPPPIATLRPDLPPDIARIIASCMSTSLDERYQTVGDLARALAPYGSPDDQPTVDRIERVAPPSALPRPMWPSVPPPSTAGSQAHALTALPTLAADTVVGMPAEFQLAADKPSSPEAGARTEVSAQPNMGVGNGRLASVFAIATVATLVLVAGTVLLVRNAKPPKTSVVTSDPAPLVTPVQWSQPAPPPVVTVYVPAAIPSVEASVAHPPPAAPPTRVHPPRPHEPAQPPATKPQTGLDMGIK